MTHRNRQNRNREFKKKKKKKPRVRTTAKCSQTVEVVFAGVAVVVSHEKTQRSGSAVELIYAQSLNGLPVTACKTSWICHIRWLAARCAGACIKRNDFLKRKKTIECIYNIREVQSECKSNALTAYVPLEVWQKQLAMTGVNEQRHRSCSVALAIYFHYKKKLRAAVMICQRFTRSC